MKPARLDALIWSLIYGGAIVLCLGVFMLREFGTAEGGPLATGLFAAGGLAAVAGVALIVVRSRRRAAAKRP